MFLIKCIQAILSMTWIYGLMYIFFYFYKLILNEKIASYHWPLNSNLLDYKIFPSHSI